MHIFSICMIARNNSLIVSSLTPSIKLYNITSTMSANNDDQHIIKCDLCPKILTKLRAYNRERHIEACKEKQIEKYGTPTNGKLINTLRSENSV